MQNYIMWCTLLFVMAQELHENAGMKVDWWNTLKLLLRQIKERKLNLLDDVKDSSRENALFSASAVDSICKVMNLLVLIFFPVCVSCFLVSKMLDLPYIWKSKKVGSLAIDLEASKVSF